MSGLAQPFLPLNEDLARPWPFGDIPSDHFGCIMADPPWQFENWSAKGEGKNPNQHYACMRLADIKALPVGALAHPDGCGLLMWVTSPLLDEGIATLKAWGFAYKGFTGWAKQSSTGKHWAFGPGYIMRSTLELCLIGTRGAPERKSASVRNLIVAPTREHSRKPAQIRKDAEALWAGPYLELFARQAAPGWTSWGNEVGKFTPDAADATSKE